MQIGVYLLTLLSTENYFFISGGLTSWEIRINKCLSEGKQVKLNGKTKAKDLKLMRHIIPKISASGITELYNRNGKKKIIRFLKVKTSCKYLSGSSNQPPREERATEKLIWGCKRLHSIGLNHFLFRMIFFILKFLQLYCYQLLPLKMQANGLNGLRDVFWESVTGHFLKTF